MFASRVRKEAEAKRKEAEEKAAKARKEQLEKERAASKEAKDSKDSKDSSASASGAVATKPAKLSREASRWTNMHQHEMFWATGVWRSCDRCRASITSAYQCV